MDMPETLTVNGVKYVREDTMECQSRRLERSYSVREIESLTGVNYQTIYRAVKRGDLEAMFPSGGMRGMRIKESDYLSWEARERSGSSS